MSHSAHGSSERAAFSGVVAGAVDTVITVGALIAASFSSAVLLADSLKTFLEFLAVLLSWMTLRRVHRGGNHAFDYGLDKLENLSSMFVAMLMIVCLIIIVVNAVISLMHPAPIHGSGLWVSMGAQVVYGVINSVLWRKNRRLAREQDSPVMTSQARLFLTKAAANVFILASLVLSVALGGYSWSTYIDPIASLAIVISILLPAIGIFSSSFYDLLDRTLEESHKLVILRELGPFVCEFTDLHEIRSRKSGSVNWIDLVLEFDDDRRVGEVQQIIEKLRHSIESAIPSSRVTIALASSAVPPPAPEGIAAGPGPAP